MNGLYDPAPDRAGRIRSRRAGLVDGIDLADPAAFRLPKRELRNMDPQHRLLLACAWHALEDAGISFDDLRGTRTGVFVGINFDDYQKLLARNWAALDGYAVLGTTTSFAANRISYAFDLRGPSVCVSVGCASSTVALHEACRSLDLGEVDLAIAGGVELMLSADSSIMLSQAGVLSARGQCRTLDAGADGYVRGEGAGLVVLKPLSRVDPSDRVYALIRGSAVNHNGRNEWIMAASAEAQAEVVAQACARGGIEAGSLDYVELHGSAFLKGDAAEAVAIGQAVGRGPARPPCRLGAVSNNIGYLGAAAGIAQLIKVCLSLHHRLLPPTIHVDQPNPLIPFAELGLEAQTRLESWPRPDEDRPNRAGVVSTSLSGSNAFVALEAAPEVAPKQESSYPSARTKPVYLLALSGHSPDALRQRAGQMRDFLAGGPALPDLDDVCFTLALRRQHHEHRLAIVARGRHGMMEQLDRFLQDAGQDPGQRLRVEAGLSPESSDGLISIASAYLEGSAIPRSAILADGRRCVSLPPYPFQGQRLWPRWLTPAEMSRPPMAPGPGDDQVAERDAGPSMDLAMDLGRMPAAQREAQITDFVCKQVAEVLGIGPGEVDTRERTLFELGLSSIGVTVLAERIGRALGISLATTAFFEFPRIELLVPWLLARLDSRTGAQTGDTPAEDEALVERIAGLSDAEAEDLIARKLAEIDIEVL